MAGPEKGTAYVPTLWHCPHCRGTWRNRPVPVPASYPGRLKPRLCGPCRRDLFIRDLGEEFVVAWEQGCKAKGYDPFKRGRLKASQRLLAVALAPANGRTRRASR